MGFYGNHSLQLDEKGRMRIPAAYRDELGTGFALAKGPDGSIYVLSAEKAAEFESSLEKLLKGRTLFDAKAQLAINAMAEAIDYPIPDDQNRFMLKANFKRHASIKKDIYVTGAVDKLAIWSAERYENVLEGGDFDKLMGVVDAMLSEDAKISEDKPGADIKE
ncbi:MAG: hypothetical protein LBQ27_01135 [Clostridiales bacterium]|jgi:MraZ protein|nr:hypothetical protein [Clostridiales bacterium]